MLILNSSFIKDLLIIIVSFIYDKKVELIDIF